MSCRVRSLLGCRFNLLGRVPALTLHMHVCSVSLCFISHACTHLCSNEPYTLFQLSLITPQCIHSKKLFHAAQLRVVFFKIMVLLLGFILLVTKVRMMNSINHTRLVLHVCVCMCMCVCVTPNTLPYSQELGYLKPAQAY